MRHRFTGRLMVGCVAAIAGAPAAAQSLLWTRQVGTTTNDQGYGVAIDGAGNAHIGGYTNGSLGGPNAGGYDYYLFKYSPSGAVLWSRQGGTAGEENAHGVAVDGLGSVYIGGFTGGDLGGPNAGSNDAFLAKWDAAGALIWTRQLGTSGTDQGYGVAVDAAGDVLLTGWTTGALVGTNAGGFDTFLTKYDTSGVQLWTRQVGSDTTDVSLGLGVDGAGNAYIAGYTGGSLGGPNLGSLDAFLIKFDPSGTVAWSRQPGTTETDIGLNLAVSASGDAHIAGYTFGSFGGPHAGSADAFITRYDAAGAHVWTRQAGTAANDQAYGVAVDGSGQAYLTGYTAGDLGAANAGDNDAFLAKYDAAGALLWTRQVGTSGDDRGIGAAAGAGGVACITGPTAGALGGPSAGSNDVFLARFGAECYPDCNADSLLTVADFGCFQTKFVGADPYADCNGDGQRTVADFGCFQTRFVAGCP